jgi:hypothetical protein
MDPDLGCKAAIDLWYHRYACSPIKKLLRFKSGDVTGPLAGSPLPVPFESSPLGPPPPASPKAVSRKISWRPLRV